MFVEAHLHSDLFEGVQAEVGRAHPGLDGFKRMFGGLASDAHCRRRAFQPILHRFKDGFVLPRFSRRSLAGVQFDFSAQPAHFVVQ